MPSLSLSVYSTPPLILSRMNNKHNNNNNRLSSSSFVPSGHESRLLASFLSDDNRLRSVSSHCFSIQRFFPSSIFLIKIKNRKSKLVTLEEIFFSRFDRNRHAAHSVVCGLSRPPIESPCVNKDIARSIARTLVRAMAISSPARARSPRSACEKKRADRDILFPFQFDFFVCVWFSTATLCRETRRVMMT